jgi:hypothetical protein
VSVSRLSNFWAHNPVFCYEARRHLLKFQGGLTERQHLTSSFQAMSFCREVSEPLIRTWVFICHEQTDLCRAFDGVRQADSQNYKNTDLQERAEQAYH